MRSILLFLSLFFSSFLAGQKFQKKITTEVIGSVLFDSERWFNQNEEEGYFYGEFRIGYQFNSYLEGNAFIGYERRYFNYFAQQGANLYLLSMERHYVPVGINFRIYLSDFFYEKLKLWKKKGRWDIYNQIGFAVMTGKDVKDSKEDYYKNQGANVPYYLYPYVDRYGHMYLVFLAGLRYNFSKCFGVLVEGGLGAFKDLQIGVSVRF